MHEVSITVMYILVAYLNPIPKVINNVVRNLLIINIRTTS